MKIQGIEFWSFFMAQLIYCCTRNFAIAAPLTFVYEIMSTCIIVFVRIKWKTESFFIFRIIFLAAVLILAVSIQYVFDLTFISYASALYLTIIWILTISPLLIVPDEYAYWIKWITILVFPIITLCFFDQVVFMEPWTILALSINWLAVSILILIVPEVGWIIPVVCYLFFWVFVIMICNSFLGITNDKHSFSQYF